MSDPAQFLNPSEAARQLGISTKALRLYEERGLIAPVRTAAGWRTYGPVEMAKATEIVALRALRLSLAQVAQVLDGDPQCLEPALAVHEDVLEDQVRQLRETIEKVRSFRADIASGHTPDTGHIAQTLQPTSGSGIAFNLPWPWGGEKFELRSIRSLNYITGPLACGKTQLARTIADEVPEAVFLGLERLDDDGTQALSQMQNDPALKCRVDRAMAWLIDDGATVSPGLIILLVALEAEDPAVLVIDMIEQGLDQSTQEALIAYLRNRASGAAPLFMLTRSSAILDMSEVGPDETIILCPANHSPPIQVAPYSGAPGYEAVTTCLASPDVRARTEGVIALRPQRA